MADNEEFQQPTIPEQKAALTQEHVDNIVKARTREAYEKGKKEALAAMQAQQQAATNNVSPVEQVPQPAQAMQANQTQMQQGFMSPEQVNKMFDERMQQHAHRQEQLMLANKIASEVGQRMDESSKKYGDYHQAIGQLKLDAMPEVVLLAHSVPNSGDVIYNLAKNPQKIPILQQLAQMHPAAAAAEMQKLSSSLMANEHAAEQHANVPTNATWDSMPAPSNNGMGSKKSPETVEDFKSIYKA